MATTEQRIYNGDQARQVLDNEAFSQAFADIKQECTDLWAASPARDAEGREKLHMMLKMAQKLEAVLRASLEDGQLARAELKHKQTLADRAKQAVGW
jgi:hypothetical protein